jgi:NTE family protein
MLDDGSTLGLALSGGGFRATLFGLGSLWRLNEAGLLGRLDRMTSVSGGSITAGVLAHRWKRLTFVAGRASNFEAEIAAPLLNFCDQTIDVGAGLKGILTPFKSAGDYLRDRYAKDLFGETTLDELPSQDAPKFVFYATNLQTGRSFRFRQDIIADYMLGTAPSTGVPLAVAVAASSAFPPIFSPIELETDPALWSEGPELPGIDELRRKVELTDGGVYDNMGLESLFERVALVLVSDAGAKFELETHVGGDYFSQLGRVRDILIDQTRALRKRWLISELAAGRKRGAYWGVGTRIADFEDPDAAVADGDATAALANVPTRLAAFSKETQAQLVNWGYALADVALRTRARLSVSRVAGLPFPQHAFSLPSMK